MQSQHSQQLEGETATSSDRAVLSDRGASMVEYALLLALLAVVAVVAVTAFGDGLGSEFSDIGSSVQSNLDAR